MLQVKHIGCIVGNSLFLYRETSTGQTAGFLTLSQRPHLLESLLQINIVQFWLASSWMIDRGFDLLDLWALFLFIPAADSTTSSVYKFSIFLLFCFLFSASTTIYIGFISFVITTKIGHCFVIYFLINLLTMQRL